MHSWYRESSLCYVHLADVVDGHQDREQGLQRFRKSEWFTRGWTLQELLAPRKLVFVDREWRSFGLREQLEEPISEITRFPVECLGSLSARREKCVASKMKWAAKRQTSRIEDKAYCLLGLFDINMPLLYGEGFKAFKRLQEEIIRQSDDETIFLHRHSSHLSPLAYSPADFDTTIWGIEVERGSRYEFRDTDLGSTSYAVTNKGIQMRAAFVGRISILDPRRVIALNCHSAEHPYLPVLLPVQLMRLNTGEPANDPYSFDPRHRSSIARVRPDAYIVDLPKRESGRTRDIEAAERYLDSWIAAGGQVRDDKPFDYQTIYLR